MIPLDPKTGRFLASSPRPEDDFKPPHTPLASPRQESPHAHQIVIHDGIVYVPDLGSNTVQRLKWASGQSRQGIRGGWENLGAIGGFEEGDGPRHIVINPKG